MLFKHGSTTGLIFIIRTLFIIIPIFLNVASRVAMEVLQDWRIVWGVGTDGWKE